MARRAIPTSVLLAATLALTACAAPAPPSERPEPTVTPTSVVETGYEKAVVAITGESQCPAGYVPEPMSAENAETYPNQAVYTEIAPQDFEPLAVGDVLRTGCILVSSALNDDNTERRIYQAFVADSENLVADLDAALKADGFETTGGGVYRRNNSIVGVYGNEELVRNDQLIDAGFVGDSFVVVMAYRETT